jgi:hypothetical protein
MSRPAALAFAPHSGWAALVAVAGDVRAPEVVLRTRVEMTDPRLEGAAQPFHAAEGLPLARAETLIARYRESAAAMAVEAVRAAVADLRGRGCTPRAAGILSSAGREGATLEAILASHALIHTADGNHFRAALAEAARLSGLSVVRVPQKDVPERAGRALARPAPKVIADVAAMKKQCGPPWGADQKAAALLAWTLLAES